MQYDVLLSGGTYFGKDTCIHSNANSRNFHNYSRLMLSPANTDCHTHNDR